MPLVHAKLLVLGEAWGFDDDEGPDFGLRTGFKPMRAWFGSANWTTASAEHLEFGLWVDEPTLVDHAFRFLLDLLTFSEPLDTNSDQPSPELVDAEWDDDAFAEYMAEFGHYDGEEDS